MRARSSAEEHYLDMVGVTGSIPVAPTTSFSFIAFSAWRGRRCFADPLLFIVRQSQIAAWRNARPNGATLAVAVGTVIHGAATISMPSVIGAYDQPARLIC